ncbi:hypothetical protein LCGC14_2018380, partial [marine sediment metagenome]
GGETCEYDLNIKAAFASTSTAQWTILVYMDGDNDLEAFALGDLNEMEAVYAPGDVQIGVLLDRAPGYDTTNGDWTDTRVGVVRHDNNTDVISSVLSSWGERNLGDESTLADFIEWGMTALTADNYALILWDHGSGMYGAMVDETNGGDYLNTEELAEALSDQPDTLDVLAFDASLMAQVEVMEAVSDYVDYFVASEEAEGGDGWRYTELYRELIQRLPLTPAQFASGIVQNAETNSSLVTMSASDTSSSAGLISSIKTFVDAVLANATQSEWDAIFEARDAAPAFAYPELRDLGGFMTAVAQYVSQADISAAATAVLTALDTTVVQNYSSFHAGGTGLSVYLPDVGDTVFNRYERLGFAEDTGWDNFVTTLVAQSPVDRSTAARDWAESNDLRSTAYGLGTVSGYGMVYTGLSIHQPDNQDWYRFTLAEAGSATDEVSIEFTHADGDLSLSLYDGDGTLVQTSAGSADVESISLDGLAVGQYYVLVTGASGVVNPDYTLGFDAPGETDDWAEGAGGNDAQNKASPISADTPYGGLSILGSDLDWYQFYLPRAVDVESVVLTSTFDSSQAILQMQLYDEAGALLASSTPTATGATLTYNAPTGQAYYVLTMRSQQLGADPEDDFVPYSLEVAEQQGDPDLNEAPTATAQNVTPTAASSYEVTLTGTDSATDSGDLTYAIVDPGQYAELQLPRISTG